MMRVMRVATPFHKQHYNLPISSIHLLLLSLSSGFSAVSLGHLPGTHRLSSSSSSTTSLAAAATTMTTTVFEYDDDDTPVVQRCKLIALVDPDDDANSFLFQNDIPHLDIVAVGNSMDQFDLERLAQQQVNAIFVSASNAREPLATLIDELSSSIQWIHTRSAGIDFVTSPSLSRFSGTVTNAKGLFSSTLAEYALLACGYFAKDLPRILQQKQDKHWNKFPIKELRGATMGIVGYGDIGAACARLAKAYGMKIVGLRRNKRTNNDHNDNDDQICDHTYYTEEDADALNKLFAESDYIVCAAPLTPQTKNMIGKAAFDNVKQDSVFINVGRGPIVDEEAMIEALKNGKLRGAGLDVVATEPLPKDSPLWGLDNVLLTPHNMDMTTTFMHESTEWFVSQNLPRFVRQMELQNKVDPAAGY